MKFTIDREAFLKPLQTVSGVVERRQTLPILANVLMAVEDGRLSVTATDMEVELVARTALEGAEPGEVTVPARKLVDICRALPPEAAIEFAVDGDRVIVRSGRSRFTLSTLPPGDFPTTEGLVDEVSVELAQGSFKRLVELTQFAMAHQDVRYYLNGLLLEIGGTRMRAVATDGHRLAVADMELGGSGPDERAIIVPRKGVSELVRLLGEGEEVVELHVGSNAVRMDTGDARFTSKLIDGKFPEYERVIPDAERCEKQVSVDRDALRQCLQRAAILSNDKYRAVRLTLDKGVLRVVANNPEQEQAEDELEVDYDGDGLEIGFNVSYLIDALTTLPAETARLYMQDASSSCLILPGEAETCRFVVMPMRL